MPNTIVVGAQWGDEGKGKDIDILSEFYDLIVRYQGGNNAGHTSVVGSKVYKLHTIPSGILRKGKINIIGHNVLINPIEVVKEINELRAMGVEITPDNLKISNRAHLVLKYHKLFDEAKCKKIGTTGRGIGPAYEDKVARIGIRMCDLLDMNSLEGKLKDNLDLKNFILQKYYNQSPVLLENIISSLSSVREELTQFICNDIAAIIHKNNGSILAESAQGTLLDIDNGTYPFVTSSNSTVGGFYTGTGAGQVIFDRIIGILKAYTTRVGEGPFPTELMDVIGERLRKIGNEFGTSTGRPRRCGWLDLAVAKYSVETNGIKSISLTKLDVLDEEEKILVCVSYELNGKKADYFPVEQLENCKPIYEELPGWKEDITKARKIEELPKNAKSYIKFIEDYLKIPIERIGVGNRRDQTIVK